MKYQVLSNEEFETSNQANDDYDVLVPCQEIIRKLYLPTSKLAQRFLDNTEHIDDDIIYADFIKESPGEFKVHTTRAYTKHEFWVLSMIFSNPARIEHYNKFRSLFFGEMTLNGGHGMIKSYLPDDINSIKLLGQWISIPGEKKVFLGHRIVSQKIEYTFNKLQFFGEQGGEQGENKDDPDLKKKTNKKKKNRKPSNRQKEEEEDDVSSSTEPTIIRLEESFLDDFPDSERIPKKHQQYKVTTIIQPVGNGKFSFGENPVNQEDSPSPGEVREDDLENNNGYNFYGILEEIISAFELYDVDVDFVNYIDHEFSGKDFRERPAVRYFNTLPFDELADWEIKKFCFFYMLKKKEWNGRRGVCVLKLNQQDRNLYIIDIEPRPNIDNFMMLCVFHNNLMELSDETLKTLLEIGRDNRGSWSKGEQTFEELGLNFRWMRHNHSLVDRVVEFCLPKLN